MTPTLSERVGCVCGGGGWKGGGGKAKMRCYRTQLSGGSEGSGRPIFILFIKENWIYAISRHQTGANTTIVLTRNLPIDTDSTQ